MKSEIDNIQLSLVELYRKFNNPNQVDHLWGIKNDVNTLKNDLSKNVNLLIGNMTELSVKFIF